MSIPIPPSTITVTPCNCSATLIFTSSPGATYYTVSAKNCYGCIFSSYSIYYPSAIGNITTPMAIDVSGNYIFSVTASNSIGTSIATDSPSTFIMCYCCPPYSNPCSNPCSYPCSNPCSNPYNNSC